MSIAAITLGSFMGAGAGALAFGVVGDRLHKLRHHDNSGMKLYVYAAVGAVVGSVTGGVLAYNSLEGKPTEENQTTLNIEYNKSSTPFVREMELINAKLATKGKKLVLPTPQPKLTV